MDTKRLVQRQARFDIWQLLRSGALNPGATSAIQLDGNLVGYLRGLGDGGIAIELAGQRYEIAVVEDMPMPNCPRPWFTCPACKRRARHLYAPELRCRRCLGLKYSRGWDLVAHLRSLPQPKRRRARYWRLLARIAQEEAALMRRFGRATTAAR